MIRKLAALTVVALLFMGCNDLFDKGDVEGIYDMDPQVELKPLDNQTSLESGGTSVAVQLIGEQRGEDLEVEYTIDMSRGENDPEAAEEGVHYTIETPSPVTIEAGTSATDIVIEYIEDSVDEGDEVTIVIELTGTDASDVTPAARLSRSTTYIGG